ncbi:MAG: hypothetical protein KJ788_12570 [Gammaproteobacteria bacterium]|nr:hypothetical protein [Gammaproteobacteria bacterium]
MTISTPAPYFKLTHQGIEIHNKPNPWLLGLALFFAASIVLSQPNRFGLVILLAVFVTLAAWWLTRVQSVFISFDRRETTFVYSSLNPLRKRKVVSLAGFTRVYANRYVKDGGWSIHLSGPRGEHLSLAQIPSFWEPTLHGDHVRSLCNKIAAGLQIADGGGV